MKSSISIFEEPNLEFRYGQKSVDPHQGLSFFGPYDADISTHPRSLSYGVIGTEEGIEKFLNWSEEVMNRSISDHGDSRLWPPYPGFEAAFDCVWPNKPSKKQCLDQSKLIFESTNRDQHLRTQMVVDNYLEAIRKSELPDDKPSMIFCIVPEEVWTNCRPRSKVKYGWGKSPSRKWRELRTRGQRSILEEDIWTTETYRFSLDFRRQIKARCMRFGIPIQIIRDTTFDQTPNVMGKRGLTPISDRAWNLATACYYKSGGKPWKLSDVRPGVCYIGISFKKTEESEKSRSACCAAQLFLDSGDGMVFLGDKGPWYSPEDEQFHLTREAAGDLIRGILGVYNDLEGKELREVFVHSRSEISNEEYLGFCDAAPKDVKIVGIRVKIDNWLKLYRYGRLPIPRGAFWNWSDRTGYLFANGFKWSLGTYDGFNIPSPLRIDILHGSNEIDIVARDILALTKLNYNACKIGSSEPVTIKYSDAVGEILISNPSVRIKDRRFRFYI